MFGIYDIQINYSFSVYFLILAIILLIGFTYFIHKVTVPPLSTFKKSGLILLRSISLILLLFLIFEPILSFSKKIEIIPKNLVFIDNSSSIRIDDGSDRLSKIQNIINDFSTSSINFNFQTFGSSIKIVSEDSLYKIKYDERLSNFENIFNQLKKDEEKITSITVISDGGINDGRSPIFQAEKIGVPVFTIGIGDTSTRNDAEVKNIFTNNFIYSETPTQVLATISNHKLSRESTTLSFLENDKLLEQKIITLSEEGVQTEKFDYTPHSTGEKKLTIILGKTVNEFSDANNKKISFINVLNDKVNVLLVAGSPSADLSFIKTSLLSDKNLRVNSITQISADKFLEDHNKSKLIDSADVFYLIGFPAKNTPSALMNDIYSKIKNDRKPFYFVLSESTDYNKLKIFEPVLPFSIKRAGTEQIEVQPNVSVKESGNNIIKNDANDIIEEWNNLPPVLQRNAEFIAKPESEVIINSRINSLPISNPLVISSNLGSRSVAVLAKDIWKWKLQVSDKTSDLFDRFILNSVRWLNTDEKQKKVLIKTNKKFYSAGEVIDFTAQVYDESFNSVNDASVVVKITNGKNISEITLTSLINGLYEGKFQTNSIGDFSFKGTAKKDNIIYGSDKGSFNIGELDIELSTFQMNKEFLKTLSLQSGGRFYLPDNYTEVFELIKELTTQSSKQKEIKIEIALWSYEWLLVILIFSLAIEWLLRKLWGLL